MRRGMYQRAGVAMVAVLCGAIAALGVDTQTTVTLMSAPITIDLTVGLPRSPLGLAWKFEVRDSSHPYPDCDSSEHDLTTGLLEGEILLQNFAELSLNISSSERVTIELLGGRVRKVGTVPMLARHQFVTFGDAAYLQVYCSDRHSVSEAETREALDGPGPVVDLHYGNSVKNFSDQLSSLFSDLSYTVDGEEPPAALTLLAGQSVSATFQLNDFNDDYSARDRRVAFQDLIVVDLMLRLRELDTGITSTRAWTTNTISILRYLPLRSTV